MRQTPLNHTNHTTGQRQSVVAVIGWERTSRLQSLIDAASCVGVRLQPLRVGEVPWQQLRHIPLDGILLERGLGSEMLQQVCASAHRLQPAPIVVAITELDDEEMCATLRTGADAIVPATAGPAVVAAQLGALLRRRDASENQRETNLRLGSLVINIPARRVIVNRTEVPLTSLEFAIVAALARHAGEVLSSSRIYYEASGIVMLESEARELMKAHMRRIRAKLQALGVSRDLIVTVRGEGYFIDHSPRAA